MPLRLFVDHCVPQSVVWELEEEGHEILLLRAHLPTDAPDPEVLNEAQRLSAVLLTINGDFADIVNYPPTRYRGIITLQIRNRPEELPRLIERLRHLLADRPDQSHFAGKLFLVEAHRIRVRG